MITLIDAYAAAALDDTSLEDARRQLDELYDHHLLTEPAPGRYLLREYARALVAADQPVQARAAVERLGGRSGPKRCWTALQSASLSG